jgi:hypothetical protein
MACPQSKPCVSLNLNQPVVERFEVKLLCFLPVLDCWTVPCMPGRFYTEPQEQGLFVWKEVTGIRENRANRVYIQGIS